MKFVPFEFDGTIGFSELNDSSLKSVILDEESELLISVYKENCSERLSVGFGLRIEDHTFILIDVGTNAFVKVMKEVKQALLKIEGFKW